MQDPVLRVNFETLGHRLIVWSIISKMTVNSGTFSEFMISGHMLTIPLYHIQRHRSDQRPKTSDSRYDEAKSFFQSHVIKLAKLHDSLNLVIKSLESNSVQNLPLI
jgi:hypothetical protein